VIAARHGAVRSRRGIVVAARNRGVRAPRADGVTESPADESPVRGDRVHIACADERVVAGDEIRTIAHLGIQVPAGADKRTRPVDAIRDASAHRVPRSGHVIYRPPDERIHPGDFIARRRRAGRRIRRTARADKGALSRDLVEIARADERVLTGGDVPGSAGLDCCASLNTQPPAPTKDPSPLAELNAPAPTNSATLFPLIALKYPPPMNPSAEWSMPLPTPPPMTSPSPHASFDSPTTTALPVSICNVIGLVAEEGTPYLTGARWNADSRTPSAPWARVSAQRSGGWMRRERVGFIRRRRGSRPHD